MTRMQRSRLIGLDTAILHNDGRGHPEAMLKSWDVEERCGLVFVRAETLVPGEGAPVFRHISINPCGGLTLLNPAPNASGSVPSVRSMLGHGDVLTHPVR